MDIFVQDEKLNISKTYLKPGFAFGGSCLPKDTRAFNYLARSLNTKTPLLNSLIPSNENQIKSVVKRIMAMGKKKIAVAGFAFKANTDDMRESPIVEVIEILLGKGYDLKIYDKSVSLARLTGANKTFLEKHIPHISNLMVDSIDELTKDRDMIIIGNSDKQFKEIVKNSKKNQVIFDLVRIDEDAKENYEGLYW
ncbi:MAG: UDP binding domain-containing protein, partial [bacterium]